MIPLTWGEWLTGGIVTTILAVIGLWWKIRSERDGNRCEAKIVAIEASEKAVGVVQDAMNTQALQITQLTKQVVDQGGQITDLTIRVTTLDQSHQVALRHISEREGWALAHWADRPQDLPPIPSIIVADVIAVDSSLRSRYRVPRPDSPDEDTDSRIRDLTDPE